MGTVFFQQLSTLDDKALACVFSNFIDPIRSGYTTDELEGKYKPSWKLNAASSNPMRAALADFAKSNNLHHYHFGYPFYQNGRDPLYFGKESDGILHTVKKASREPDDHIIFRVDKSHPNPFSVPMGLTIKGPL